MKWTAPQTQTRGMTCPDLELILHTGSPAVTFQRQTYRYSFQVMMCKALRAPHDCAMVSCSRYLCSIKKKKVPNKAVVSKKVSFKLSGTALKGLDRKRCSNIPVKTNQEKNM